MTKLNWWKQNGDIKLPELKNDNKDNNIKKLSKEEIKNIVNNIKIDDFEKISLLYWPYLNKEDYVIFKKIFDNYKDLYKKEALWKFPIFVLLWIKNNYIQDELTKICIDRRLDCGINNGIYDDVYQNYLINNNLNEIEYSIEKYIENMNISCDDADAITLKFKNKEYEYKIYNLLITWKLDKLSSRKILIEILKSWNCIITLRDVASEEHEYTFKHLFRNLGKTKEEESIYSPLLTSSKNILEKYWIDIEDIFKTIDSDELNWYFNARFRWSEYV